MNFPISGRAGTPAAGRCIAKGIEVDIEWMGPVVKVAHRAALLGAKARGWIAV